ncbi:MAG: hypothetical protein CME04_05975 [Gemmatimonadaceae bacterium]|nr:hypothetical protein [Gemmatimonadaceae bacterium]
MSGQSGGRFVQHEGRGFARHGFGDLDNLLPCHAEITDAGVHVDVDLHVGEHFCSPRMGGVPVDERPAPGQATEQDVFGHRQAGHQAQLLVDDGDAVLEGGRRCGQGDLGAVDQDLT